MKNTWIPFGRFQLAVLVFTVVAGAGTRALGRQGGWAMYRGDAQNTSVSPHVGLRSVARAWDIPWADWRWRRSGLPAVAPDGTIYMMVQYLIVGQNDLRGELMAVRADGSVKWSAPLLESQQGIKLIGNAAPLIGPDGAVYVGWLFDGRGGNRGDRELTVAQAYDPDGNLLWSFEERISLSAPVSDGPIMGSDGTLYLALATLHGGGLRSSLFALDSSDGSRIWRFISPNFDDFDAPPALGRNGKLYYASSASGAVGSRGYLYRLDATGGEMDWERRMQGGSGGSTEPLTIDQDGNLYVADASWDGQRTCTKYDPDGNELWTYETGEESRGSPVVQSGKVYLAISGSGGGRLDGVHVLDAADGRRLTILEPEALATVTPAADRSGNVFFISDYKLVGYSAADKKLWEIDGDGNLVHNILLGHDGLILTSPGTWGLSAFGAAVLVGDLNCDGAIDAFDIEPFLLILFDPPAYAARFPGCAGGIAGDVNVDGAVNAFDIEPFLGLLFP